MSEQEEIPYTPEEVARPEGPRERHQTTNEELSDLVAEYVMGWELIPDTSPGGGMYVIPAEENVPPFDVCIKCHAFFPGLVVDDAFMALREGFGYGLAVNVVVGAEEDWEKVTYPKDEMLFRLDRYKGDWAVSLAILDGNSIREIYDKKLSRALCLAMLYRKGVRLPEHPEILWEKEEDFE